MAASAKGVDKNLTAGGFFYRALLVAGLASILMVFILRLWSMLSTHGLIPTSGVEGSGSYGVFRACSGLPFYQNFNDAANVAVFNFLFYEFYGMLTRLFGACDDVTPLLSRLLSLAFVVALAVTVFLAKDKKLSPLEAALVAAGAFSFYIGWWAFAIRPDVGAALFLALCIVTMLSYLRNPRQLSALAAGFFLVCAWGFKQPYAVAGPVLLWFIFRTNPRHAAAFCLVVAAGIVFPFLVYGMQPYYLHTMAVVGDEPLFAYVASINVYMFLVKGSPTLLLLGLTMLKLRKTGADVEWNFLWTLLIISSVVMGVAAAKAGAVENYYFPSFVTAMFIVVKYVQTGDPQIRRIGMGGSAVLSLLLACLILSGFRGNAILDAPAQRRIEEIAAVLNQMPAPKLVWEDTAALPWFTKDVETRILWDAEVIARIMGGFDPHKSVADGHYKTIAIPNYSKPSFDLSGYQFVKGFDSLLIYSRRQ
ncbi:MAG: hypothetical protein ABI830_00030 [Pseudolabrys sp.]